MDLKSATTSISFLSANGFKICRLIWFFGDISYDREKGFRGCCKTNISVGTHLIIFDNNMNTIGDHFLYQVRGQISCIYD